MTMVTRAELYDLLRARLSPSPRALTSIERQAIAQAAALAARVRGGRSFRLRPGLVAEMLRFYDLLRRQLQRVDRFEQLIDAAVGNRRSDDPDQLGERFEGEEIFSSDDTDGDRADKIDATELTDRGARRMREQTRFLARAFREYERRVVASGACDEHVLRERLLAEPVPNPLRHIVVTVADWIVQPDGLYVADFDLLARLPDLAATDIVCTENVLRSGFHERLHGWMPGIEEDHFQPEDTDARPVLVTQPGALADTLWWIHRDREEELAAVSRRLNADRRNGEAVPTERVAIVYKHPLPYLYLAEEIFGRSGIGYQTSDTLPLATEPTAASLDLLLETVASDFTRASIIALLRSPHFVFKMDDGDVQAAAVSELDRALSDNRYLGALDQLERLADRWSDRDVAPALSAVLACCRELAPLATPGRASVQLDRVLTLWNRYCRPLESNRSYTVREERARAAVAETLASLVASHERFNDAADWNVDDVAIAIRRAIEDRTFEAEAGQSGVQLLDDRSAPYGDFDDVSIVGVIESDWPESARRNIFYPSSLLRSLGWPLETDRRGAADARFVELLSLASRRTSVSAFTLDDDVIVSRSLQLDEIPRARLTSVVRSTDDGSRVFEDEALWTDPPALDALPPRARVWAMLRSSRTDSMAGRYHGLVLPDAGPSADPRLEGPWSVSALETYLGCPFRFFSQHVLELEEEPDDEEIMDPRRQGRFVHEVFERFFSAWQRDGHRAITPRNLGAARDLFTSVVDHALEALPGSEAGLERTRLLGSSAAAGLGEAVFRMEAERPTPVVERLLEYPLAGAFEFQVSESTASERRTITLRGKADRIDLLEDGTFRLIDYKLGWPPNRARALQLPIYALCAEQRLRSHRGQRWNLGEAVYLAFKGPRRIVPLFSSQSDREEVLVAAQQRMLSAIDAIALGRFPPTPDDVFRCESCAFSAVCRKDYVGES